MNGFGEGFIYDFDHPETWVDRFEADVVPVADDILDEIAAQKAYDLSSSLERLERGTPETPEIDRAINSISREYRSSRIRCFHATRLLDLDAVLSKGLKALDLRTRARAVADGFCEIDAELSQAASSCTVGVGRSFSESREGLCSLVPSRTALHDGGLSQMFDLFGGEAINDLLKRRDHVPAAGEPGRASVVVAVIPTTWCGMSFFKEQAARRILLEVLRAAGKRPDAEIPEWDVQVAHDIPPGNIELICDRYDPRVAPVAKGDRLT